MESACDIFYSIHENDGPSDIINDAVRELDFHTLSITLLATTASHNESPAATADLTRLSDIPQTRPECS